MKTRKLQKPESYSLARAAGYWTKRVRSTDPLAAVLTYNAPRELNKAYDLWEKNVVRDAISKKRLSIRSLALDIGCGTGRITELLAEKGCPLIALDISKEMLARTRRTLARNGFTQSVEFVESPAHRIPLPEKSLDLITCCGVLEHLTRRHRDAAISEIARTLKPGGSAFVMVNNDLNPLLKSRKPGKSEKIPGYHAELVGCDWLERVVGENGLSSRVVAANPFYGLVHYGLCGLNSRGHSPSTLNELSRFAIEMERDGFLPAAFVKFFASHFLVELRRRVARN